MRIAIDIDSTLHDYWQLFSRLARKRFGVALDYEHQITYEIDRLRPEQVAALTAESHAEIHVLDAVPYAGAVETVAAWHEAGHFIHVTSHRAAETHDHTAAWLDRIGLPYDELYCSFDKVGRCREIAIDVLIDDSPTNIEHALEAGITVATLRHPWNSDVCDVEDVIAADDWAGLEAKLAPLLGSTVRG